MSAGSIIVSVILAGILSGVIIIYVLPKMRGPPINVRGDIIDPNIDELHNRLTMSIVPDMSNYVIRYHIPTASWVMIPVEIAEFDSTKTGRCLSNCNELVDCAGALVGTAIPPSATVISGQIIESTRAEWVSNINASCDSSS